MGIRDEMPLLYRTLGKWDGTYTWVDVDGKIYDRHRAQLNCELAQTDGQESYTQSNVYTWPDGREETHYFPAAYRDKELHWDTDRIKGHCWEVDAETLVLTWVRKDWAKGYFYEIINVSPDGLNKNRVWQFFEDGKVTKRTLINEVRVQWGPDHDFADLDAGSSTR